MNKVTEEEIKLSKEKRQNMKLRTDNYYMDKAKNSALLSRCKKIQRGCILLLQDGTYIKGTNGAPFPLKSCDPCPRINSKSGQDYNICRAVHAERQTLLKSAKWGLRTEGAKLYSYMGVPCKDCCVELIQAGVSEIICSQEIYYDELSKEIVKEWVSMGGILRFVKV